jgi:hypothetical protein
LFTFTHSFVDESVSLLFVCLSKEFRDECFFISFSIELSLGILLINDHLSATTVTVFTSEIAIFLGFFDLIHHCGIREVLNLAWRNSFLLLLLFDGLIHTDTLLNA